MIEIKGEHLVKYRVERKECVFLQVEDERDAQLQPRADHAERRGAETQL